MYTNISSKIYKFLTIKNTYNINSKVISMLIYSITMII